MYCLTVFNINQGKTTSTVSFHALSSFPFHVKNLSFHISHVITTSVVFSYIIIALCKLYNYNVLSTRYLRPLSSVVIIPPCYLVLLSLTYHDTLVYLPWKTILGGQLWCPLGTLQSQTRQPYWCLKNFLLIHAFFYF